MKKQKQPNKILLGVTGSLGTGKSTVAAIFKSFGAKVVDADNIAHQLIKAKGICYKKIVKVFGKAILKIDKEIDRGKLARIVFDDDKLLRKLNNIIHPAVIRFIKEETKKVKKNIVVLDVPLLFESGLDRFVDKVIVVKATQAVQIKRMLLRRKLAKNEILTRIKAQMPLSKKVRLADFVIDNNGVINKTKEQVENLRRKLWKS